MHTKIWLKLFRGALGIVLVVALGMNLGVVKASTRNALGSAQRTASLPASTCTPTGPGARTCDLWASAGTLTLPGAVTVPIWGYADTALGAAQVPGPSLIVDQGDNVTVILHNNLSEASAVLFTGQAMPPDLTGAAAGGTTSYTFTASNPGTFLYEAGLLPNAQHQVAMGLYGALIVRPLGAPGQAYTDPATAFTDEALVILGEIDPILNNSVTPSAFDMRNFAPRYYLINGKAYPQTDEISVNAGVDSTILLRYINAGIQYHSMTILGLEQILIANDAFPLTFPEQMSARTIGPGVTQDVLVTVPSTVVTGTKFAVYDGNFLLNNNGSSGFGGMLAFISLLPAPPVGPDATGPNASALLLTPNPTVGLVDVALTASTSDLATGGSNIQAAEYFIDNAGGLPGSGNAMIATDGVFDSPTEAVNATITSAVLTGLASGNHTFYVRGQDAVGNWGQLNFIVLNLDKTGPTTSGISLTPNSSNGTVDLALNATGDDHLSGNGIIVAAEYFIGTTGLPGTGTAMTVTPADPVASLSASIPTSVVIGLVDGAYTISVRSQDELGNWGAFGTISMIVDKTGPDTSSVNAIPNPNNGTLSLNTYASVIRVSAIVSDPMISGTQSNISIAEGFLDTVGPNGTGFAFNPHDGMYNSPSEVVYSDIFLSAIVVLPEGAHTIYVHGKDSAGNWGATSTTTLILDKTGPAISGLTATPNPTNISTGNNTSFVLTAVATDPVVPGTGSGSNVVAAEWFEGIDPGAGSGTAMTGSFGTPSVALNSTINFMALGWTAGNHTVYVRAKDAAGNWGAKSSLVVTVVLPNNIFSDGFDAGNFAAWSSAFNVAPTQAAVGIIPLAAAAQSGGFGMQARVNGNTPGYVIDTTPNLDTSYHARFYFNPHGTTTATAAQGMTILSGNTSVGTTIFQVQYRRVNVAGGIYQVRLAVLRVGGTSFTNWFTITNNAWTSIEIAWQSGTSIGASLYTNGTLRQTLPGLNTSAYLLDEVRLGPSAGLVAGAAGTLYIDSFISTRNTVIGLAPIRLLR